MINGTEVPIANELRLPIAGGGVWVGKHSVSPQTAKRSGIVRTYLGRNKD